MAASYNNVMGGKLVLKKGPVGITKKKKKRQEKEDKQLAEKIVEDEKEQEKTEYVLPEDPRTPAEKKMEEARKKREQTLIAQSAQLSHRQKVEKFNEYLNQLSEHYDIPKVGPG